MKKTPRPEALARRTTAEPPRQRERTFVADPPKALPPSDWVHIQTPEQEINRASNAEIAFWLRLKSTPGCLSKRNPDSGTMHLHIEPNSEAAVLFVQRMIKKLPPAQTHALLPDRTAVALRAAQVDAPTASVTKEAGPYTCAVCVAGVMYPKEGEALCRKHRDVPSKSDLERWASALEAFASLPDTPGDDYDLYWRGAGFLQGVAEGGK